MIHDAFKARGTAPITPTDEIRAAASRLRVAVRDPVLRPQHDHPVDTDEARRVR